MPRRNRRREPQVSGHDRPAYFPPVTPVGLGAPLRILHTTATPARPLTDDQLAAIVSSRGLFEPCASRARAPFLRVTVTDLTVDEARSIARDDTGRVSTDKEGQPLARWREDAAVDLALRLVDKLARSKRAELLDVLGALEQERTRRAERRAAAAA